MRVAFCGNICNNFYQLARGLRAHSDVDAHLFVNSNDFMQLLPESDDPEVLIERPPWIHWGHYLHRGWPFTPWKSPLIPLLKAYDLVVASDWGLILGPFAGKPLVFFATGGDLTAKPFPLRFLYLHPAWKDRFSVILKGYWSRRAFRIMQEMWVQPLQSNLHAIRDLKIDPQKVSNQYFPLAIDARKFRFRPAPDFIPDELKTQPDAPKTFRIFHPTRIQIDDYSKRGAKGQGKGNTNLFQGFKDFLAATHAPAAKLIIVDRDTWGDTPRAKRWIAQAGLENHVIWLKPPRPSGFTRHELIDIYSLCDVVADQFPSDGQGFGSIVLEACACSRPVVTKIDEGYVAKLYPWHPLLGAATPAEVSARLAALYADPASRQNAAERSRQWIEEFHSHEAVAPLYAARLRTLVDSHRR